MNLTSLRRTMIAASAGLLLVAAGAAYPAAASPAHPVIVLIGGDKQGYPRSEHDYPDGIQAIERLIKGSPQLQATQPVVKSFPAGFPADLSQIADADVVLLYHGLNYGSGGGAAPGQTDVLDDPARLAAMRTLMDKGVGLIALHQASTVPVGSKIPMDDWLGAIRFGLADRTTEVTPVHIAGGASPIKNGLKDFDYLDEFYPTLTFSTKTKVTPALIAKVHIQTSDNKPVFREPPTDHVVAWTAERPNGGRSFGFTGGHYLLTFDQPQIRTALLNALLWTTKHDVPATGATTNAVPMPRYGRAGPNSPKPVVVKGTASPIEPQPWGTLQWFSSRALGNTNSVTTGMAIIRPGKENPLHRHPNADEVLHVIQGHIMNKAGDSEVEMVAGDTVTVPEGMMHQARNIGTEDAILIISYNTPDRIAIGE